MTRVMVIQRVNHVIQRWFRKMKGTKQGHRTVKKHFPKASFLDLTWPNQHRTIKLVEVEAVKEEGTQPQEAQHPVDRRRKGTCAYCTLTRINCRTKKKNWNS